MRLFLPTLAVVGGLVAGGFAFQLVSQADDVDVSDEVVQVVRTNERDGRDVAVLEVARAERWGSGFGPPRGVADRRTRAGNPELAGAFDRVYRRVSEGEPGYETADLECRYWPVVPAGEAIEEVEGLYRACYDSDRPGAYPHSTTYLGVEAG